jgi:hypothetical protein
MKFIIVSIMMFILIACTGSTTDVNSEMLSDKIRISGALNTEFNAIRTIISEQNRNDITTIYFSGEGIAQAEDFRQQFAVKFFVKTSVENGIKIGHNYEIVADELYNQLQYKSSWDATSFTELQFQVGSGEVYIDRIDESYIYGQFRFQALQKQGRRMIHGQVEDLNLADQGEISVNGIFSAMIK